MAIDCYKFFFKKRSNRETFLPNEITYIYYDLRDESKREDYEKMFYKS